MNKEIHVWERLDIVLEAQREYRNPYMEVDVWVDLEGPGFSKRVYGFWDGGATFKVRVLANNPGEWSWTSGSNQDDAGLNGIKGSYTAIEWTEAEKQENSCRRGFIEPTANGHAFQYADGTPVFLIGDTWWATPTFRYKWYDDDTRRPFGPDMGFKEMVQYRKKQGFNCIAMLAGFPHWANDGLPCAITMEDGTWLRAAWRQAGTKSAKDMYNEGGRPFFFPGRIPGYEDVVPDFERINPEYFKYMDLKIDYLNDNGFTPFIEVTRRDLGQLWKKYYEWPGSYSRYIQYIFARYQANNCLLSPIHYDYTKQTITGREYNEAANLVVDKYGHPPFGTLVSANSSLSSLLNFGGPDEAKWLTFHQTGNFREHEFYWYLTEIFNAEPARPALNGEPYYPYDINSDASADEENQNINSRSSLYGSLLSGGLAGYIYGAEGMWGGDIEPEARFTMWDALKFKSGDELRHVLEFLKGINFTELIPDMDCVLPNRAGKPTGYRGWAYCARTKEKDVFLYYFEKDCPQVMLRGLLPERNYSFRWFDPRNGSWRGDARVDQIKADQYGRFYLPPFIGEEDWGLVIHLEDK